MFSIILVPFIFVSPLGKCPKVSNPDPSIISNFKICGQSSAILVLISFILSYGRGAPNSSERALKIFQSSYENPGEDRAALVLWGLPSVFTYVTTFSK